MKKYTGNIAVIIAILTMISCDQERLEPELETADGGGTLDTYTAYSIGEKSDTAIYGRVVFYLDDLGRTLVQVSVYNTEEGTLYPTRLMEGMTGDESATLISLYDVEGKESNGLLYGELSDSKFYVISDTAFYDTLSGLDAHISLYSGTTVIATGDIGANTEPVEVN